MHWHFSSSHLSHYRLWRFKLISGKEYWICQLKTSVCMEMLLNIWGEEKKIYWSGEKSLPGVVNISTISLYIHNNVFSSALPLTSLTDVPCSCSNYSRSSHFDRKVHWLNNQSAFNPPASSDINYFGLPVHMIKEVMCSHTVLIGLLSFPLPLSTCSITGVAKENRIVGYLKPTKKLDG